jgi:hypothetical protein
MDRKRLRLSLTKTALREMKEGIGWVPHRQDGLASPFLGAAFNLKWGRNLNSYCHFHTNWTLKEISSGLGFLRRARKLGRGPSGFTRAADAWEIGQIIPIPISAVGTDGYLEQPFQSLVGDARHVRGLLFCLAQSKKFCCLRDRWRATGKHRDRPHSV